MPMISDPSKLGIDWNFAELAVDSAYIAELYARIMNLMACMVGVDAFNPEELFIELNRIAQDLELSIGESCLYVSRKPAAVVTAI